MSKYLIELTRFNASFLVEYDEEGDLLSIHAKKGEADHKIKKFFWQNAPYHVMGIEWYKRAENVVVSLVPEDLSFERFWKEYAHKEGKKSRCENKWSKMSDEQRIKALKHIQKYNQFLSQNPSIARKYPETYLNAEAWNN